jgi:hypothetical protein
LIYLCHMVIFLMFLVIKMHGVLLLPFYMLVLKINLLCMLLVKVMSSICSFFLHTLGHIEFDDLCNLDCLEPRIFAYADLPRLSKYSYHVIGKYNNKGQYMVHRVYICTNLSSPFVLQDCDRLESNHHTNIFTCSSSSFISQEGKHYWCLSMIFGVEFSCNKLVFLLCHLMVLIFCWIVMTNIMCLSITKCPEMLAILCDMT